MGMKQLVYSAHRLVVGGQNYVAKHNITALDLSSTFPGFVTNRLLPTTKCSQSAANRERPGSYCKRNGSTDRGMETKVSRNASNSFKYAGKLASLPKGATPKNGSLNRCKTAYFCVINRFRYLSVTTRCNI
jgi:hypothetical protein